MASPILQFKRGNAGVAGTVPALRPGEPAFSLNNLDFFVGFDSSVTGNKFFGSHRYWGREDGTTSLRLRLVDKDGTNSISLKTPDTLSGIGTFVLPDTTDGIAGDSLRIASKSGNTYTLEWAPAASAGAIEGITVYDEINNIVSTAGSITSLIFAGAGITATGAGSTATITVYDASATQKGVATFSTDHFTVTSGNVTFTPSAATTFSNATDNTLGTTNTGAVQIAGGAAVTKNLTVGAGLSVVGNTVIAGNTVLGNATSDTITATARFNTGLTPSADATYDVGAASLAWRNANFSGIGTFTTGVVADGVQIGINGTNVIDTVSGNLTLNSAGGTTIIDDAVTIQNNLTVNGNVTVGGTTVTLRGQDVFIENKDIILGYTTSITPNDDTANHAGVAIASTVGSPLANFDASGINTLPSTYKQMMWFKNGTLGFGTDAFAFNYGVAIGTTQMANGIRFKVGSGITMTDTAINATTVTATTGNFTNLSGTLTGTISTATRAQTVDVTESDTLSGSLLFAVGTGATAVLRDDQLTYDSNTNVLTTAGNIAINGGTVTTTGTAATIFNANATTVSAFGAATALVMGATSGIATINNPTVVGSQATQNLYNSVATNLNFGGAATALVMGATTGVATIRNSTFALPNATAVSIDGTNPTISGTSTGTLTLFNANLTKVNAFQAATDIVLAAATGITTIRNSLNVNGNVTLGDAAGDTITVNGTATFGPTITGTISTATKATLVDTTTATNNTYYPGLFVNSTGTATTAVYVDAGISYASGTDTLTLTGNLNVNGGTVATSGTAATVFNANALTVNAFGAATALVMGAATGITTVSNNLTVGGDIRVNGNDIQASDGNNNITLTSNTLTTFAGDIRVNGNDIQGSDGVNAITFSGAGNVGIASNLTVTGNLVVNGTTTQVNTQELQVYDRTITLGITSGTTPTSTSWDLGVMMNYGDAGVAKTAGVIWEFANKRFQFASSANNPVGSASTLVPQIAVTNYAPIEISSLWINGCGSLGALEVIKCNTTEIVLQDITVDAGTF